MTTGGRTAEQNPADAHDVIRVVGARENNLRDIDVVIPKRRLTVFTGVSGSGKSSLVFATIAAESRRLVNETYSAFVQGFMEASARPAVDRLEGLTAAITVDQERLGANPRSTLGTVSDVGALLRVLYSTHGARISAHLRPSPSTSRPSPVAVRSLRSAADARSLNARHSLSKAGCARAAKAWAGSPTST